MSRAEPVQHHLHRQDRGQRICLIFSGVLRRAAVNRLEHRVLVTNVPAYRQPQSTCRRRAIVANDVTRKIRSDYDVVPFGIADLPLTKCIDISIVKFDIGKLTLTNFAKHFAKEAMRANDV